jgi:uncharacterized protein YndB with AHSA1/START domain
MTPNADTGAGISGREIVVARVFDAPRGLVWQVWTDPQHVARWWGPRGFTTTIETMDVRPGGVWKHVMRGPDGARYPGKSVFTEVVKPERIVLSHGGGREGGPEAHFVSTWTFETVEGGATRVTIRMVFPSAQERDRVAREFGAVEGGNQTLERLAEHLAETLGAHAGGSADGPAEREVVITRVFDAPRDLVFRAWTDSVQVARWWGPASFTNPVCELDARPGGAWRIVMRGPDGNEYPCQGVYREVVRPERLVFTNDAVDDAGSPVLKGLTSVTFEEDGAKTRMTMRTRAVAVVPYARAYLAGMEAGWTQSIDRLAAEFARAGG